MTDIQARLEEIEARWGAGRNLVADKQWCARTIETLLAENAAMREALRHIGSEEFRNGLLETYAGGHHYDGHLDAFQHGMNTVCNVLERRVVPQALASTPTGVLVDLDKLRELEWAGVITKDGERYQCCPVCAWYAPAEDEEGKHDEPCWLGNKLKAHEARVEMLKEVERHARRNDE